MDEAGEKTPEVATTRRTRVMFNWMMLFDAIFLLPRFVIGLLK